MDKENVVTAIKDFILPELKEIKDNQAKMSIRLDAVEKRLSDINGHLVDQSRRIDETNNRIDEVRTELTGKIDNVRTELTDKIDEVRTDLTGRIGATNNRIDQLTFQVGKIAQEMERIKREESVTSDILTRLRTLEQKTANL
ncbi:coiled-coil protein [Candidatus Desulfofervidus auxilii]|uniref:Coiled-coil protein n=1 Tax=Desulfofervidus auxilii TaxID=1621989 RepID=A0A7U4QKP8_DESA2|nr:hypothetical protein [Candidatus Desulfofervidus auxilii]AMM41135.1 coiled-coil protein [Candidatus Desulfofervidus auxilii]